LYLWSGAEEETRHQEVLQFEENMQQQQRNLAERESRLVSQEDQHAKEEELCARCADLDRREASLKHGQDNLSAGQAQLAKGRHVLQSASWHENLWLPYMPYIIADQKAQMFVESVFKQGLCGTHRVAFKLTQDFDCSWTALICRTPGVGK